MIRNVVVGKLKPGVEPSAVRPGLEAIVALPVTGCAGVRVGLDAGLRAGGWDFAITSDWTDAEAYRGYDLDEEHDRVRRELFDPFCEQIARVQFEW